MSATKTAPKNGGTKVFGLELGKKKNDAAAAAASGPVERPAFTPTLPTVDLVSPSVRMSADVKKTKKRLVVAAAGTVGGIALLYLAQAAGIAAAQNHLAEVTEQNQQLTTQITALSPVRTMFDEIATQNNTIRGLLGNEVLSSNVVKTIDGAMKNMDIASVTISYAAAAGGQCANVDPFNPTATVGCVTITAYAKNRADIGDMLNTMAKNPALVSPYVAATSSGVASNGDTAVSFTTTVGLGPTALSNRWNKDENGNPIAPPAPAPAPGAPVEQAPPAVDANAADPEMPTE